MNKQQKLMLSHPKSPYQMRIRIATSQEQCRLFWGIILLSIFRRSLLVGLFTFTSLGMQPSTVAASPTARDIDTQVVDGGSLQYVLLPIDATDVELQTFMADFFLSTDPENFLTVDVQMLYRVHNISDSAVTLFLRVAPNVETSEPGVVLSNPPAFAADGIEISLLQADNTSLRTQIQLAPDGRSDLTLRYRLDYKNRLLPKLHYAIGWLDEWQGDQSLRVSIALPETIAPESWVRIEPEGWNYALSTNPQQPDVKWLFEAEQPTGAFVFQVVAPNAWSQIEALAAQMGDSATVPNGSPNIYSQLGDLYRRLYQDPSISGRGSAKDEAIRQRFYAAALAAFTTGLEGATAAGSTTDAARLHASLAELYRSRVVGPNGQSNALYATLMQEEAVAALGALPLDDARRAELMRWQSDGLLVQFEALQRSGEWTDALTLLDELETLTTSVNSRLLNPERLASDRRAIRLQQALELLQSNNRDAALALAGEELANDTFQPPPEARSLFESWRITTTIGTQSTDIELLGQPAPDSGQAAREAVQQLIDQWRTSSIPDQTAMFAEVQVAGSTIPALRLRISLADVRQSDSLAQLTPTDANWALLRALLFQLNPTIIQSNSTIWEQVALSQPLDLRTAGDHWSAMAISLEQQSEQYATGAATEAATVTAPVAASANAEAAVQAQIQAINYRNAAQVWRDLAQNSWATVTLRASVGAGFSADSTVNGAANTGAQSSSRSWVADVTTPAQQLYLDAQFLNPVRLLGSIVLLLTGLFMLSGLLWWLL